MLEGCCLAPDGMGAIITLVLAAHPLVTNCQTLRICECWERWREETLRTESQQSPLQSPLTTGDVTVLLAPTDSWKALSSINCECSQTKALCFLSLMSAQNTDDRWECSSRDPSHLGIVLRSWSSIRYSLTPQKWKFRHYVKVKWPKLKLLKHWTYGLTGTRV